MIRAELRRHKLRTVLTILGIIIGIFLITTMVSFSEEVSVSIEGNLNYMSGLVTVLQKGTGWANYESSEIDEDLVEEFRSMSDVEEVAPLVMAVVPDFGNVIGFNMENENMFSSGVVGLDSGRNFEDGARELVIGYKLAEEDNYVVGDILKIRLIDYEVVGIWKETGTKEDNAAITSVETAQEIIKKPDKITMAIIKPNVVEDAPDIAEEIMDEHDDLLAVTDKDAQRAAEQFLLQINMMIYSIGGIATIIAGIVIMNVMFMSVRERRREIGAMKAIGATDLQILSEIMGESILISFIGGLAGLGLSFLAVKALNSVLGTTLAIITPKLIVISISFALILGLLGGILPARQAAKLDPVVALRYE